jgi:hypothetical protein
MDILLPCVCHELRAFICDAGLPCNLYELHRAKRQSESVRNPRRIQ